MDNMFTTKTQRHKDKSTQWCDAKTREVLVDNKVFVNPFLCLCAFVVKPFVGRL